MFSCRDGQRPSRGFIVAAPVAYHMAAGFVPIRKRGKLPWKTEDESYQLEYGEETIEMRVFSPR